MPLFAAAAPVLAVALSVGCLGALFALTAAPAAALRNGAALLDPSLFHGGPASTAGSASIVTVCGTSSIMGKT